MPGMTHMQHAQPILFSHFLLAHAEAFFRDMVRLDAAEAMADACPMGSGALAGCALDVDRGAIARELGFARPTANSLDAASDRDFALDYLYALAVIATHLSRLVRGFRFVCVAGVRLHRAARRIFHRQQPDAAEKKSRRVGTAARQNGPRHRVAAHAADDAQRACLRAISAICRKTRSPCSPRTIRPLPCSTIAAGAVAATRPNEARMREAASDPALLATEAAHYLVRRGAPFRQAHEIVGQIVREGERAGKSFSDAAAGDAAKVFVPVRAGFLRRVETGIRAGRSRRGGRHSARACSRRHRRREGAPGRAGE